MSFWNLLGFGRKSRPVLDQQFLNRQRGSLPLPRPASATETVQALKDEEIERLLEALHDLNFGIQRSKTQVGPLDV